MDLQKAIEKMKSEGFKYTTKREDMVKIFSNHNRYLTAKEVLETLRPTYPGISFDTIYRNLSLFVDLNIIESTELNGEKHFRFRCNTDKHHHHFICIDCGTTKSLHTCPMDQIKHELGDCQIIDHKFEIYGTCSKCQN